MTAARLRSVAPPSEQFPCRQCKTIEKCCAAAECARLRGSVAPAAEPTKRVLYWPTDPSYPCTTCHQTAFPPSQPVAVAPASELSEKQKDAQLLRMLADEHDFGAYNNVPKHLRRIADELAAPEAVAETAERERPTYRDALSYLRATRDEDTEHPNGQGGERLTLRRHLVAVLCEAYGTTSLTGLGAAALAAPAPAQPAREDAP